MQEPSAYKSLLKNIRSARATAKATTRSKVVFLFIEVTSINFQSFFLIQVLYNLFLLDAKRTIKKLSKCFQNSHVHPPSSTNVSPVIYLDPSRHKKTTALAMSCVFPIPSG